MLRSTRPHRFNRGALAAATVGVVALLLGYGCRPVEATIPPLPAWAIEPVSEPSSAATVAEPLVEASPIEPADSKAFDPLKVVPILDEPELHEVRELAEREAYRAAAERLDAQIRSDVVTRPAWLYQLALLRSRAGLFGPAVEAFDQSAKFDWALRDHAHLRAAELLVDTHQPAEAIERLDRLGGLATLVEDASLLRARALFATRKLDDAASIWRAHLGQVPKPKGWQTEALRFVRALLEHPTIEHAEEAITVAESVLFQSKGVRGVAEAKELRKRALLSLPFESRKKFEEPSRDVLLTRLGEIADANRGREALAMADALLGQLASDGDDAGAVACAVHSGRGKALASLRRYAESADEFTLAVDQCEDDALATALYLGARSALRGGRPAVARGFYAELERRLPGHRLADDARLHGAETARDMGDLAAFTSMLMSIATDYPNGDMVDEGLFALALSRIVEGDWAGAVLPLERSLAVAQSGRPYWAEGRPQYFLGRAKLALGQRDEGKALLASVVREFPLSYFMLLAHARLRSLDPALAASTLAEVRAGAVESRFVVPDHPDLHRAEFLRAVELVRVGDAEAALEELETMGVRLKNASASLVLGSAALLGRIGAAAESHGLLRSSALWLRHYPSGAWRPVWELAYPRPYRALVPLATARFAIPEHLAYAIMREESAFRPTVSSPAAAHGLMQMIVPTAKAMAKPLGLAVDEQALKTPAINITLGCRFLSVLTHRFDFNPLLAIPGYNAGPGAPERWLSKQPSVDFDLFVESIPYKETREYTKRVMKTMAAYAVLYGRGLDEPLVVPPLKASPASAPSMTASPLPGGEEPREALAVTEP